MRRFLIIICFLSPYFAAAQPVYISGGGGVESGIVDSAKLGREDDFYSNMFITYFGKIEGEFSKYYLYRLAFQKDPLWQNTANADLGFVMGAFQVMLGVQVGMFDFDKPPYSSYNPLELEYWDLGIDGDIKMEFPGIFFVGFQFILNIGGNWSANKAGSSHRQFFGFTAGFWLPHILISGGYYQKDYDEVIEPSGKATRAGYNKLYGKIEFFAKNVPFRLGFEAGKIDQTANINNSSRWLDPIKDDFISGGAVLTLEFGRFVCLNLAAQAPLSGSRLSALSVFSASAGLTIIIPGND